MSINIHLFIEEEEYGMRSWDYVPRKDDLMSIGGDKKGNYRVSEVYWWQDTDSPNDRFCSDKPRVSLMLTKTTSK